MKLIGIVRLGRDAEVRYTPNGNAVCEFSGAFDYGPKAAGERRAAQWVDFKLWGDRGDKLAPYLLKGQAVLVCANDVHIEEFKRADGSPGHKLTARVDDVEFAGPRPEAAEQTSSTGRAPAPPAPAQARPAPAARGRQQTGTGFDAMDDDIPF